MEYPLVEGAELRAKIDDSMVKLAQKWQSMYFDDENRELASTIPELGKISINISNALVVEMPAPHTTIKIVQPNLRQMNGHFVAKYQRLSFFI